MTQSVLSFLGLVFFKARHVNFALGTSADFFFGREGNFTAEEVSGGFLLWGGGLADHVVKEDDDSLHDNSYIYILYIIEK